MRNRLFNIYMALLFWLCAFILVGTIIRAGCR